MAFRTQNPALSERTYDRLDPALRGEAMTVNGAIGKTVVLLALAVLGASTVWGRAWANPFDPLVTVAMIGGSVGGLAVAITLAFKKTWAPALAPVYALVKGLALGGITALFERMYPGIAVQAVGLTALTLFFMLTLYRTGVIKVTQKFMAGVMAATLAVFGMYAVSMVMMLFTGSPMAMLHSNGPMGIGISLVIVGIAALNLVMDFHLIFEGERRQAPKYMEWYGAFALMVTLVWLYIELLRLLAKLRSR
jgi:uncharacterized YccA/Bax inhibitor family protein